MPQERRKPGVTGRRGSRGSRGYWDYAWETRKSARWSAWRNLRGLYEGSNHNQIQEGGSMTTVVICKSQGRCATARKDRTLVVGTREGEAGRPSLVDARTISVHVGHLTPYSKEVDYRTGTRLGEVDVEPSICCFSFCPVIGILA